MAGGLYCGYSEREISCAQLSRYLLLHTIYPDVATWLPSCKLTNNSTTRWALLEIHSSTDAWRTHNASFPSDAIYVSLGVAIRSRADAPDRTEAQGAAAHACARAHMLAPIHSLSNHALTDNIALTLTHGTISRQH